MNRRTFLGVSAVAAAQIIAIRSPGEVAEPNTGENTPEYWWYRFPTFAQIEDPDQFKRSCARMVIHGNAKDPTWGPFGQLTSRIEDADSLTKIKAQGARAITWIEGFGDCMIYVAEFKQLPNSTFEARTEPGAADLARVVRSHWNWSDPNAKGGNAIRWVGIHNLVDNEDFVKPLIARVGPLTSPPTYPDGRPAIGTIPGRIEPVNHRIYDACGSKDLNGSNYINPEATAKVNTIDPTSGKPVGPLQGLYPATVGKDDVAPLSGQKPGDTVYCGVISVHKDLSAPFWRQYVRRSIKEIVAAGLDGVWCDNYSPWDNFGYPPVQKAFGDWAVSLFHAHIRPQLKSMNLPAGLTLEKFDVREALKARAEEFGAKNTSDLTDAAWKDARWLDEPVWCAFKAFRQQHAQTCLKELYKAIHSEATSLGRPDFCINGNDVPMYGLGWVRDEWQDMINTETTPGWHMGSGSRGITIPPEGKMAIMYRAALEHQKGPYSAAWYYLNSSYAKYQQKPELGKLLCAEAFANGAFLLCMPDNHDVCGTVDGHAWWNRFIRENEPVFAGRTPLSDVAVVFSPDNQLYQMTPGGYNNIDDQPHIFGHHGWATACIDAHIPYRALTDWKITPANLANLRALVLPHVLSLSDAAISAIVAWLKAGGRLVVSGEAGSVQEPGHGFARREGGFLQRLGIANDAADRTKHAIGKGVLVFHRDNPGQQYYLNIDKRADLLPSMAESVGTSGVLVVDRMPSTVGTFAWKSSKSDSIFIDLVNYDIDLDVDSLRSTALLRFSVPLPLGWSEVRCETISPDLTRPAKAEVFGGGVDISLDRLTHYASIKLTRV